MKERVFTITLLLCVCALNAVSQKAATIRSFTQTADHISGSDRRNDFNGDPCALVKVQVVDEIARVEGNRIGDIVNKGVEKWVYMCKGSRNMRIHLKNHLPVKIMFQDYQINGLESNRVYELVIETPDTPNQLNKQKLVINYTPTDAMVLIDSKAYRGNGRIETELPVGEHRYIIAANGYISAEGVVKLNEQGTREITERLTSENSTLVETQSETPSKPITNNSIYKNYYNNYYNNHNTPKESPNPRSYSVSGLKRGFKGYLEVGYALDIDDDWYNCGVARAVLGYQFNSHLFTGVGAGLGLYSEDLDVIVIPVFANVRYYIFNKRTSPFVDIKGGYSFEDMEGVYLSPSIGCRFALGERLAITTSVCLEAQQHERKYYYYEYGGWWDYDSDQVISLSLGLKIGFEF